MMAISSSEYAFTSADDTLSEAHGWHGAHIFWLLGVWVLFQAAVAFPAGRLRESGKVSARSAMMIGAAGAFLGYLSLASSPRTWASGSSAEARRASYMPPASTWWVSGIPNAKAVRPVSSTVVSPTG